MRAKTHDKEKLREEDSRLDPLADLLPGRWNVNKSFIHLFRINIKRLQCSTVYANSLLVHKRTHVIKWFCERHKIPDWIECVFDAAIRPHGSNAITIFFFRINFEAEISGEKTRTDVKMMPEKSLRTSYTDARPTTAEPEPWQRQQQQQHEHDSSKRTPCRVIKVTRNTQTRTLAAFVSLCLYRLRRFDACYSRRRNILWFRSLSVTVVKYWTTPRRCICFGLG